jgi:hypothetical protein
MKWGTKTMRTDNNLKQVLSLGIDYDDAITLRRISMTLRRWHELECGDGDGYIERNEKTGRPMYYNARARYVDPRDPRAWRLIPDRETGARKRLDKIMAKYPDLKPYIQGDPRGCALYLLRPNDVPAGKDADAYYSRGIPVY